MNVQVERVNSVEAQVSVEIPQADVDKQFKRQIKDLGRSISLPGFRRGKAPRQIIEARFGDQIAGEVTRVLLQDSLFEALDKADVVPLGEPDIENGEAVKGQPFQYVIKMEIRPEFDAKDYRGLNLPGLEVSVTDEEVDAELQQIRERSADYVPADEGTTADTGLLAVIDFEGSLDGELFEGGSGTDMDLELGSGRMIPGFEDELMGAAVGDVREFDITFPEDYHADQLAGKATHFKVTIKALKRKELPELDDEFAKDKDHDDLAAFRAATKERLEETAKRQAESERAKAVTDALIEANPFDVPPKFLARQVEQQKRRMMQQFGPNVDPGLIAQIFEGQDEVMAQSTEREIREHFILARIAGQEEMQANDEDLEAYFKEMAESTGMPLPKVKSSFHGEDAREGLKFQLTEKKVREAIIEWAGGAPAETTVTGDDASEEDKDSSEE